MKVLKYKLKATLDNHTHKKEDEDNNYIGIHNSHKRVRKLHIL